VWTVQSAEAFNAFTYGGVQMTQFPVTIYRPWLQTVFLWIVPVGFTSYYPALWVLGRPEATPLGWLAPAVGVGFLGLALCFWTLAIRRYTSTGS
jgi:ABC-2 type transport system permease protein